MTPLWLGWCAATKLIGSGFPNNTMSEFSTNMQANLPQHTVLHLKVKALKTRVHCVCRRYSSIETETMTRSHSRLGISDRKSRTTGVIHAYDTHTIIPINTSNCLQIIHSNFFCNDVIKQTSVWITIWLGVQTFAKQTKICFRKFCSFNFCSWWILDLLVS